MSDRDFFTFCTSLKPIELKAIGELSRVDHLEAGQVVYSPGDNGEAFYIIDRGAVVVEHKEANGKVAGGYLTRGDIFGDLEALTSQPRSHLVRTSEPVSLQCFQRENFPELARRVPSFFLYFCQRLAHRLAQAHQDARDRSHCLEMSGNLSNFDLITIYQTIINSDQNGELQILDDNDETIAAFAFVNGRPCRGRFQHLAGEEAFWQLFQEDNLSGTFKFSSGKMPAGSEDGVEAIERYYSEMLVMAVQRRDELHALREQMPKDMSAVKRQKLNFDWPASAPAHLQPVAEQIWQLAYSAPIQISTLYEKCSVCKLKIFQVVSALVLSGHFNWAP